MTNFRGRVLNAFIIFVTIVFLLLGVLVANLSIGSMERQKLESYETQLKLLSQSVENSKQLQKTLENYSEDIKGELTYYAGNGKVVASTLPSDKIANPNRFKNGTNKVQRLDRTDYIDFIQPRTNEKGTATHYLALTLTEEDLNKDLRRIWIPILLTLFAGYALLIFVTFRLTHKLVKPVDDAMRVAKELAQGNYKARSHEYQLQETGALNHSLNVLARNLEQITQLREAEQKRMKTVIENMGSGLLLIDAKGYINLINRSYKDTFQIKGKISKEKFYHEIMPHQDVVSLVEETFLTEAMVRKQILLSVGITRKAFDVTCVPIIGDQDKLKGIVLVFHDITELKNLEQMRKDFVANVSHELRTPVTSLKGFAETLLDGAMEKEELRKKFLTIIWKESDRLQRLIHDLLEFTKMEQANFQLDWQWIDIESMLDDVSTLLESRAQEKEIGLKLETVGDLHMEGDAARLKQILINLINNALAYTQSGGTISIRGWEETDAIHLQIEDTGIGIDKEEIPRIFERFYRIDKARSRNSGGTGLGLAIVRHLVEAHQGTIQVTSEQDIGTTFFLSFSKIRRR